MAPCIVIGERAASMLQEEYKRRGGACARDRIVDGADAGSEGDSSWLGSRGGGFPRQEVRSVRIRSSVDATNPAKLS